MEIWARRIKDLLDANPRLTQRGLADACRVRQPSISQWFNTGESQKPATKMLSGDNLVAAARYLGSTPEYIMTGRSPASHAMGIDSRILANANTVLQQVRAIRREPVPEDINADALAIAYQAVAEEVASSAEFSTLDLITKLADRL